MHPGSPIRGPTREDESEMPSRTIAFIHGNFVSRHCWDAWVPRCEARGYACHAIAYPGREGSVADLRANPDNELLGRLTLDDVVDHHVRSIQALGEKPIVIVRPSA